MNTLDIILSIFLLLGVVRGFFKGFFVELAGLVALILGIYGAIHFSHRMYAFLDLFITWEEKYLSVLAFALTFILIVVIISIIGKILTKMAGMLALGIVNRFFGGVFGLLKMAFLASIFLMFLNRSEALKIEEETKEGSVIYPSVARLAPLFLPGIIETIKEGQLFETSSEEEDYK
ncbi:CvpA family protein [Salinimicrobium sp. GXAS 041]|uniref:CvpA family protein n=1 Tax=Salinimicrobium sp. GXAS 041 TaxID=3400806 RepID=UPI003C73DD57